MSLKTVVRIVAVLAVVAVAIPAIAKPITRDMSVTSPAMIGSAHLEAGRYRLVIDGEQITVKQGREVVAETRGRWETRETKYDRHTVLVDANKQIREIRFAGKREVLILE